MDSRLITCVLIMAGQNLHRLFCSYVLLLFLTAAGHEFLFGSTTFWISFPEVISVSLDQEQSFVDL